MAQGWTEIASFYDHLSENTCFTPMARLAEQIAASPYCRLHAWTSMLDLCIAQSTRTGLDREPYLRISPLPDGRVEFRYLDTHIKAKQWSRIVESQEAFSRFERFIEQLRWFPNPAHSKQRRRRFS